ncbi:MAG: type II 3-dehydroquinate dehydratase [Clostridia bacterium]|nr:type II 3-dehydroquinate dehydratase [Clostridia bacterium]
MKILIINGPNLNMLGIREPEKYGNETLSDINGKIKKYCDDNNIDVEFYQSNIEGEIINKIHSARGNFDGIIMNAGAFTHYSYAIRDAIPIAEMPVVEVHLTNVHSREEFRHKSVIAPVCKGQICGFGSNSYLVAVKALELSL